MAAIAEKYGVSKTGLYIVILLVAAIVLFVLLPNPNKRPKSLGDSAPSNAYNMKNAGAGADIAAEASKGSPAAKAAAEAKASSQPASPPAAPPQQPPQAQASAAPPAAAAAAGSFSPDKIRHLDPFAPLKKTPAHQAEQQVAEIPKAGPAMPLPITDYNYPYVEPSFTLNGIYAGADESQSIAIINGQMYRHGQNVGNSEYYIEAIDGTGMKEVRLRNRRTGDLWPLPFNSGNPSDLVTQSALKERSSPPPIFNPATNSSIPLPVGPVTQPGAVQGNQGLNNVPPR